MLAVLHAALKQSINAAAFKGVAHSFITPEKKCSKGVFVGVWEKLFNFNPSTEGHMQSLPSKGEQTVTRTVTWVYPRDRALMCQFVKREEFSGIPAHVVRCFTHTHACTCTHTQHTQHTQTYNTQTHNHMQAQVHTHTHAHMHTCTHARMQPTHNTHNTHTEL
jgi:hypothetical protein